MEKEQITKLKELAQAASIDLPVEHDDYSSIRSKTGNFVVYDEGGATEEQARYVVELINLAPELIAAAERTTSPVSQMTDEQAISAVEEKVGYRNRDWWDMVNPKDLVRAFREVLDTAASHAQAPAAPVVEPAEKPWHQVKTVTMDGHQLREALDFLNPDGDAEPDQLDEELTFGVVQHKDDDGTVSTGLCCWNDDTDGVYPLTGDGAYAPKASEPAAQPADLSKLTRYDEYHGMAGSYMTIKEDGDYVMFEDVEALLAAAAPAPATYPTRECAAEALTPSVGAPQAVEQAHGCASCGNSIGHDLDCPSHPANRSDAWSAAQPQAVAEQGELPPLHDFRTDAEFARRLDVLFKAQREYSGGSTQPVVAAMVEVNNLIRAHMKQYARAARAKKGGA